MATTVPADEEDEEVFDHGSRRMTTWRMCLSVAATAILLAGCGATGEGGVANTSVSSSASSVTASIPDTSQPNVADPVLIGTSVPLSGLLADEGEKLLLGYTLAIQRINQEGGILGGRPIELVHYDDGAEPAEAAALANRLISADGVVALLGTYGTSGALTQSAAAEELQTPNVQPYAASPEMITRGFEYLFNLFRQNIDTQYANAEFLNDVVQADRIAYVYENAAYALPAVDAAKERFAELGIEVAVEEAISPDTEDFSGVIAKIRSANVDAVNFFGLGPTYSPFMLGMRQNNVSPRAIISATSLGIDAQANELLGDTNEYALGNLEWDPDSPAYQEVQEAWFSENPDADEPAGQEVVFGYATADLLAQAIDRAGSTDPVAVRDSLRQGGIDTALGTITFDERNQYSGPLAVAQVRSGEASIVWPDELARSEWQEFVPWSER